MVLEEAEDAGNGSDRLEGPAVSLAGKLRLRLKSGGAADLEVGSLSVSTAELAFAAGAGGTPRRAMRKPSGKAAVAMPPSGKSLAQGCASASVALGRDC